LVREQLRAVAGCGVRVRGVSRPCSVGRSGQGVARGRHGTRRAATGAGGDCRHTSGGWSRRPATRSPDLRSFLREPKSGESGPYRPKPAKLATNLALRAAVEQDLEKKYSPEQITGRLLVEFPDDPEMRVSPETIYQSLYVQSRGALRRDLAVCLRTGRARPSRKVGQRKNRIPNMINIAERPPEVEDRAVPGNWEGDLVRHEALCNRAEVKDLRRCAVAAA